jgi:hypothetical protein
MSKNNQPTTSAIEQHVMETIRSGQARMRSRAYYLSLGALGMLVVALLGFITSYFMSVMSLWIRIQTAAGPAYGAKRNLATLVDVFPWWALLLGLGSLVGIIYIVRKFGWLYKIRSIYLIPVLIAAFLALGFAFSYSPLPDMLYPQGGTMMQGTTDATSSSPGNGLMRGQSMK